MARPSTACERCEAPTVAIRECHFLDDLPGGGHIRLIVAGLAQIDHTCAEVLADWIQRRRRAGTQLELAGLSDRHASNLHRRLAQAASA